MLTYRALEGFTPLSIMRDRLWWRRFLVMVVS